MMPATTRFFDNRQKYLMFVTTCGEKWAIAQRAGVEVERLRPEPPALRLFDAGVGDGTVLTQVLRQIHHHFPTVPILSVAKEISLEDVRLTLDKLPDRLLEHPQTVVVLTNMLYREAPHLRPSSTIPTADWLWHEAALDGTSTAGFHRQIRELDPFLTRAWEVEVNPKTGNPRYKRPAALVIYRSDHRFALDAVIPRAEQKQDGYDLILASQPYQARASASFKVKNVLAPLARTLRPGGRMLVVQSAGNDPGMELINRIWPDEDPFRTGRGILTEELKRQTAGEGLGLSIQNRPDTSAIFRYHMHSLPRDLGHNIGTSTIIAAWNAAVYVAQIEDLRSEEVMRDGRYIEATQSVLAAHDGLWFNDEAFVITRPRR
jgi:hypothetical protein